MDKKQILEQLQHILAVYNQILRAAGYPSDMRGEIDQAIDDVEAMYEKLEKREVINYKQIINKRNQI